MKMPLTLSLYIARQFSLGITVMLGIAIGFILIFDTLEIIRRTYSQEIPFSIIIEMVLLKMPNTIEELLAFIILLGSIVTYVRLTRTSELIVTRAAGVSAWQFLFPSISIACIIGLFIITIFNPVAAALLTRFEKLEAKYFHGSASMLAVSSSGLWLRQINEENPGKNFMHALRISQEDMTLHEVMVLINNASERFEKRLDADAATLENGHWILKGARLTMPGRPKQDFTEYKLGTTVKREQILESFAPPETLSFWELPGFIKNLTETGFSALPHRLHWHKILTAPFFYIAMVLFAAVFSLRPPRQGKTGIFIVMAIITGFAIYFFTDVISALGLSGSLPVVMAAWLPVSITLFIAIALVMHREDG